MSPSRLDRLRSDSIRSNGIWNVVQQATSLVTNSVFAFLLLKFLTVEDYGVYSYALALSAAGMAIMNGGLSNLAVKEILSDERNASRVVAGVWFAREALGLVAVLVIALVSLTSGSDVAMLASVVVAFSLFGRAMDAPEFWFRAHMRSHVPAMLRSGVALAFFALKCSALIFYPNLWVFVGLYVAEAFVAGIAVVWTYWRARRRDALRRPAAGDVVRMTRQSLPLLLSGVANQVNLRGDIVVIQAVSGSPAVGIYSAAARISELAYFLPTAFMNASLPELLRLRRASAAPSNAYRAALQRSYDLSFWSGIGCAIGAVAGGSALIYLFLDPVYRPAITVLAVHAVACPFVFMAAVYSKWIIVEGFLWLSLARHIIGAVANVLLCVWLVPIFGIEGAAVSTVASYVAASFVATFVDRRSRAQGVMMARATLMPARMLRTRVTRKTSEP